MSVTARTTSSRVDWLLFLLLGFFWGSSYLFIKIGVDAGLQPFTLVTLRLLIGFALLAVVVAAAREPLPRGWPIHGHLVVMGFLSVALPFTLITVAEQHVDSALAATLTAPVPLFVIPIAAVLLHDERITLNKVAGVSVGLVGVAVLVGFDIGQATQADLVAELMLIGAALSYAMGGVYARRAVRGLRPMIPALYQVFFALLMSGFMAFLVERPLAANLSLDAIVAVAWLGVFGSGLAYLLFFRLLGRWGATRTSLVAYLLPLFGIVLGAAVLAEPISAGLIAGTALILLGIALVNREASAALLAGARTRLRYGLRGRSTTPTVDPRVGPR